MKYVQGLVLALVASGIASAQESFDLVSATPGGRFGNGESIGPAVSGDGRFVAFASFASDLVPGDTNGTTDLFVRDLDLGITERVSLTDSGAQVSAAWTSGGLLGISTGAAVSSDGSIVPFTTLDPNVVAGDTNGVTDLFVRDRAAHRTERVSLRPDGGEFAGHCGAAQVSADGRRILFAHRVPQASPFVLEWYVRDRAAGTTQLVSVVPGGTQLQVWAAKLAAGGRHVIFSADRLSSPFAYGTFVRDIDVGVTVPATPYSDWRAYDGSSLGMRYDELWPLAISASGRFALCDSNADLDPTDGLESWQKAAWVLDRSTAQFRLVTRNISSPGSGWGAYAEAFEGFASVSDDGRTARLRAWGNGLIGIQYDNNDPLYEVDMSTTETRVISLNWHMRPFAGSSGYSNRYSASEDGGTVAVQIIEGSFPNPLRLWGTSDDDQIYVRRVRGSAGTTYCAGDGSGAACPCGIPGIAGRGCANDFTTRGALLTTRGNASISDDTLTFLAYEATWFGPSYLLQSATASVSGGVPFEGGVLCVGSPVLRIALGHPGIDNQGVLKLFGRGAYFGTHMHELGAVSAPGTRYYQVWTRPVGGPSCLESRSSLTNGVRVEWRL